MAQRGLKGISVVQTVLFFITALAWTLGDNRASMVAMIIMGWILFVTGVVKIISLFVPMDKKYSATFCGLAFAIDMALIAAVLTLYFIQVGFSSAATRGGLFSDIFMIVAFVCVAVAEAGSVVCSIVENIDKFDKK